MFILQLICIIHWSIQLKWRNLLKLKKKKNKKPVNKQVIWAAQFAGLVFGLALTRPQLLWKTDVVQRSLSKRRRRWPLAGQPPASINQSEVSSPILPVAPAPHSVPSGTCLRGHSRVWLPSLPAPSSHLSLRLALTGGGKAVCCERGCPLQNAGVWGVTRWFHGISEFKILTVFLTLDGFSIAGGKKMQLIALICSSIGLSLKIREKVAYA